MSSLLDRPTDEVERFRHPGHETPVSRAVLLVDDDARWRAACTAMLTRAGLAVTEAADGEEAWSLLLHGEFHLVVTDYIMPKASGLALVRRMRVAGMNQPVILAADSPDIDVKTTDPWQRIDGVVIKPFTFFQLMNRIETVLRPDSREPFELRAIEEIRHPV